MNKMTESELFRYLSDCPYKYRLAIFTDRADFVSDISSVNNLLEVRVFDESGEFRAYRDLIGKDFKCREIIEKTESDIPETSFEENHYLDIDTKFTFADETEKQTTGGGRFHLPEDVKDKTMIKVRYYYRFNSEGLAQKCDWRLVGFDDKEDF